MRRELTCRGHVFRPESTWTLELFDALWIASRLRAANTVQVLWRSGFALRRRGFPQELRDLPAQGSRYVRSTHLLPPVPGVPVPLHNRFRPIHEGGFPAVRLQ